METNKVIGSSGKYNVTNTSPIYGNTIRDPVIPNKIDNSKLHYSDPADGIKDIYGYPVKPGTWVGSAALQEFSDGYDPDEASGDE